MTQRSYSELIALLPDNTSGLISPSDMRDVVDSVRQPHAGLYESTPVNTTIAVPGTYYKAAGTFIAQPHSNLMTADTTGRITYNGISDRHFHIVCSISMTCASNNQDLAFRIAKNGVTDESSEGDRKVGTGSDVGAIAIHADLQLATNDYIELFVTNKTSTALVTLTNMYLFIVGMF